MKTLFFFMAYISSVSFAAEFHVPSIQSCPGQAHTVQSVNGEAFQGDLSLPEAAAETLKNFQSCSKKTVTIQRENVACHEYLGYLEVCAVPSDVGQFLIVKDHVDGASIHVFPKTEFLGLEFSGRTDFAVPVEAPCYQELLRLDSDEPGSRDHRNVWIEFPRSYKDMRQASSLALRQLPKALNLSCSMPFERAPITEDSCILLNGIQSCFVKGISGYFITARGIPRNLTVGFYRWD